MQADRIGPEGDLSAKVLATDPSQLRGQLTGRLLESTDLDTSLWAVRLSTSRRSDPWLAPITPALAPADPIMRRAYYAGQVTSMTFSLVRKRAVTGSADGRMRVWDMDPPRADPKPGAEIVDSATGTAIRSLALLDYGSRVLAGGDDGSVRIQELFGRTHLTASPLHRLPVTSVAITSDETLAVTGSMDGTLLLWTLPLLAPRGRIQTGQPVLCSAVSAERAIAVTGGRGGALTVWSLSNGARVVTLGGHSGPVRAVAMTDWDTRAVTAGEDGTLRMWALAGGSGPVLDTRSGPLTSVAVTPDTKFAVTGGRDGAVRLWNLQAKREVAYWQGDSAVVNCVLLRGEPWITIAVGQENGRPYQLELRT